MGTRLLDFIFPPLCSICRVPVSAAHNLCGSCWSGISFLSGPLCEVCGFPFDFDAGTGTLCGACRQRHPAFDKARALMRYDDNSRNLVLALKRADRLDLVPAFARWLERTGRELLMESDLIVPVPLHYGRLWRRRFNQSALVAAQLGRRAAKPVDSLLLRRVRATPSQGEMPSASARRRNMQGAFRADGPRAGRLAGKTILLIDDVFTTGATIEACARALKRGGARRVFVLALARVVRPMSNPL
ncbi:MAG TPA: ComF family protein [Rhizomicrobium sp.]|nr:ComF family protein [Rhizomicrobium sp.]